MNSIIVQQFFRELLLLAVSVIFAYVLVGGFIFMEERLKRTIIQSLKK